MEWILPLRFYCWSLCWNMAYHKNVRTTIITQLFESCVWILTVQETWLRHFREVLTTSEAPVASEITLKMLWFLNLQWQSCQIQLERCSRSHVIWLAVQLPNTLGRLALLIKLRDRYENKWWGCKVKSSQVTFIYIALLTIQIVTKQLHNIKMGK